MKIFSLQYSVQYEGSTLLGVFETLEDAQRMGRYQRGLNVDDGYEVLESELGQPIDSRTVTHDID